MTFYILFCKKNDFQIPNDTSKRNIFEKKSKKACTVILMLLYLQPLRKKGDKVYLFFGLKGRLAQLV